MSNYKNKKKPITAIVFTVIMLVVMITVHSGSGSSVNIERLTGNAAESVLSNAEDQETVSAVIQERKTDLSRLLTCNDWEEGILEMVLFFLPNNAESEFSEALQISYPDYLTVDPGSETAGFTAKIQWIVLPDTIRVFVADRGWKIRITNDSYWDYFGYSEPISGLTVYGDKKVFITDERYDVKHALYHEIGHIVDAECGYPSNSEEFRRIYDTEASSWEEVESGSGYGRSSPQEYFAETFKYILRYGDAYADTAPKTYAFVQRYIP